MNRTLLLATAVSMNLAGTAAAQAPSPEVALTMQSKINSRGRSCPSVTAVRAYGLDTAGNSYAAVACSDGGRFLVGLDNPRVVSCNTLEGMGAKPCFPR
jgi:hypothetical protein